MKVYARTKTIYDEYCGKVPYNVNIANAIQGLHECGIEIHLYENVKEIYDLHKPGDLVLDGIYQVNYILSKYNIIPKDIDYPEVLKPYLGRKIWTDKINHINVTPELWPVFVKAENKKITGTLIREPKDLIGCGSCYENYDITCSEPVEFVFECRGFMYYDKMIDLRPYKGDWRQMKNMDTNLIDQAIKDFSTWEDRPNACSLDWGVTKDGRTLFVEQNLPYSLGCYGLTPINYAKMISAYTSQLFGLPDELHFE